jgi:alanine racemase
LRAACSGERNDGHQFIESLYKIGIRQFIVQKTIDVSQYPDANFIVVSNVIDALQKIVTTYRTQFSIPVIGITGSNGKTIVKEWLFQLLSPDYAIVKNPGSYNSQTGVPLSVWNMQEQHELGIFEAGISQPGEMERLEPIIHPDIGIFTNIGSAHDEGFKNVDEKIAEKLKLFARAKILIYCSDHIEIKLKVAQSGITSFSWSVNGNADVIFKAVGNEYTVTTKSGEFSITSPFSDSASLENLFHCITLMIYFKYEGKIIKERIQTLRVVSMRLELKDGINSSQIIDDSYNNDLGGLQISLDFLKNQKQKLRKRIVLSDMLQTGLTGEESISKIANIINGAGVDSFIGIGPALQENKHLFSVDSSFYETTDNFLEAFKPDEYYDEVILVKGARTFHFERIVNRLQRKHHGTVMEIDLESLVHNLNFFKTKLPSTKLMVMVKAFAYGSGSTEVANVLQYHRVDYLGVAYVDEGVDLRRNNIKLPIMVMNPSEESYEQLLTYNLEPEVYSFGMLKTLIKFLKGKECRVHVKLDTGMHRLGFVEDDINDLLELLKVNKNLHVASIFSHLAAADESQHDDFSMHQGAIFKKCADMISATLTYKPLYHILNSSGILRMPQFHFDMVRLGIGLFGVDPTALQTNLKPVATLKTIISQIKHVPKGESIGYGRMGNATQDISIATIAIGYADGFSRAFSRGKGEVLIRGMRAPVIGNVCMDMTMVDVTGIPASEGDEVIIFGESLSIQELAKRIGTIPYEILTNTSERVKRVFVALGI